MKASLIARLLPSIKEGRTSISTLGRETRLGETVLREVLTELTRENIGQLDDSSVIFRTSDKVKAAIVGISLGCSLRDISETLDWRTFESFTAEVLQKNNYETHPNVFLKNPRLQLDLIGRSAEFAICVDCKDLRRLTAPAAMKKIALRQAFRTKVFVESPMARRWKIEEAMPLVITLRNDSGPIVEGVPVVPIGSLQSFIYDIDEVRQHALIVSPVKQIL